MSRVPGIRCVLLSLFFTTILFFLTVQQFTLQRPVNFARHSSAIQNEFTPPEQDSFEPNEDGVCTGRRWPEGVPPLYIITPTYPRAEQLPELTRLGQTLMLVDSLVWIVVDDADMPTPIVLNFLKERGICHVYLMARMPAKYQNSKNPPRGVANRLKALDWIRQHAKKGGVLYFADDDNSYDSRLFEEMRNTKKVSMFPVGLVTKLGLSSPIVRDGKVTGFYDGWIAKRKFPVDMAGFAVNVDFFLSKPNATMPYVVGYEETKFLDSLGITKEDIELLANSATRIMVWHTKTKKNPKAVLGNKKLDYDNSNIIILQDQLWR